MASVSNSPINQSKLNSDLSKVKSGAIQCLSAQLRRSLQDEVHADISLNIEGEFTCFNKCLVLSLAPELSPIFLDEKDNYTISDKMNDVSQKEKLALLYKSDVLDVDLGQLFINLEKLLETGMNTDIVIELADGKKMNCHKCILAAHSQYFEMMFGNAWKESQESYVKLNNIPSETFKVLVDFMYAAKVNIPESVDAVNLIFSQDLLNIKGFQSVLHLHLKAFYCHFFHTPCDHCIESLTNLYQVVVHSNVLGYGDLIESCNKWFVRYFAKIFGNRCFLKIPKTIRDVIVVKIKESINCITIIPNLKDCAKLGSLPNVRWAKEATKYVKEIESYCLKYACDQFDKVTAQPGFKMCLLDDKNVHVSKMLLEIFVNATEGNINIQNCIMIYNTATALNNEITNIIFRKEEKDLDHSKQFTSRILDLSQTLIRRNYNQLRRTLAWKKLSDQVKQDLIKDSGFVSFN